MRGWGKREKNFMKYNIELEATVKAESAEAVQELEVPMNSNDRAMLPKHDLTEHWQETLAEGGCIAIIWSISDVKTMRPDLTDAQCMDVLEMTEAWHDANLGVTWDTLEIWAEDLFPSTPETTALLEKIEELDLEFGEFAERCRPNETAEQTIARIEAEDAVTINPA